MDDPDSQFSEVTEMKRLFAGMMFLSLAAAVYGVDPFANGSFDFREVNWGLSEAQVRAAEPGMKFNRYVIDDNYYYIVTNHEWSGEKLWLSYHFRGSALVSAQLIDHSGWDDPRKFWDAYTRFLAAYSAVYGEPANPEGGKPIWKSAAAQDRYSGTPEKWGEALAAGVLEGRTSWETDDTRISLSISARNGIVYFSAVHDMK